MEGKDKKLRVKGGEQKILEKGIESLEKVMKLELIMRMEVKKLEEQVVKLKMEGKEDKKLKTATYHNTSKHYVF